MESLGYTGDSVQELFEDDADREDPKDFLALFTRIEALDHYVDTGVFDRARAVAGEVLAERSDIAHVHARLGEVAIKQGKFDEAFERYSEAVRLDPSQAEWYVNLGILLSRRGEPDAAIDRFRKAIHLGRQ